MAYFYASMGVVMLAGILAVFEIGTDLSRQETLAYRNNQYFDNANVKQIDIEFLSKLSLLSLKDFSSGFPSGSNLCQSLRAQDVLPKVESPWQDDSVEVLAPLSTELACTLYRQFSPVSSDAKLVHRVLIVPLPLPVEQLNNDGNGLRLFSCVTSTDLNRCPFEREVNTNG